MNNVKLTRIKINMPVNNVAISSSQLYQQAVFLWQKNLATSKNFAPKRSKRQESKNTVARRHSKYFLAQVENNSA